MSLRSSGGLFRSTISTACMLMLLAALTFSNSALARTPKARQILQRAAKPYMQIRDYTVDAKFTVKSSSMHVPDMAVRIYFKSPDKLHIESRNGFAVLPRQGALFGNPVSEILQSSDISLQKQEKVMGQDCYVVRASFARDYQKVVATVWVDKEDYLIRQMAYVSEFDPAVKIRLSYIKVANRYWMPDTTWAEITAPPLSSSRQKEYSNQEHGQPTTVTAKFSNYKINTGLSDDMFKGNNNEQGGR